MTFRPVTIWILAIASLDAACFPAPPCQPPTQPPACHEWSSTSCGWIVVGDGASCDDGDLCTQDDTSVAGTCKGSVVRCTDERTCTTDVCDATGTCVHDASACACTTDTDCDDSNPCTVDTCSVDLGRCDHDVDTASACDDNDECTLDDKCSEAGLCAGTPKTCSDGRSCSVDTCVDGACSHDDSDCDCASTQDCDDDDPCTDDECTFEEGRCIHTGNSAACDDGDPCTVSDHCDSGACVGGGAMTCTLTQCALAAQCDPTTGKCVSAAAQDGLACDGGVCATGACVPVPSEMVLIPGGTMKVGDNTNGPIHIASTAPYFVDIYETTAAAFAECVDAQACERPDPRPGSSETYGVEGREAFPVNLVTWQQASAYCVWRDKRLCSEVEWEKAAHGGCELYDDCLVETPRYPWGTIYPNCSLAIFRGPNYLDPSGCGTMLPWPVGSLPDGASPYGALDMIGNIAEWVEDCWHASYGGAPTNGAAWTQNCDSVYRVVRGGDWGSVLSELSTAARTSSSPVDANYVTGFRCCKDALP